MKAGAEAEPRCFGAFSCTRPWRCPLAPECWYVAMRRLLGSPDDRVGWR